MASSDSVDPIKILRITFHTNKIAKYKNSKISINIRFKCGLHSWFCFMGNRHTLLFMKKSKRNFSLKTQHYFRPLLLLKKKKKNNFIQLLNVYT